MPFSSFRDSCRKPRGLRLRLALWFLLASLSISALADDEQDCTAAGGSLLVGVVVSPLKFRRGTVLEGIELSHTHVMLNGDADAKTYDVAIDNVFASGYQNNMNVVPSPLTSIQVGDKLEVCGIPYAGGMDWVHTNCGDPPTPSDPNGWVKKIAADGSVGPNLEVTQTYCYLWQHK